MDLETVKRFFDSCHEAKRITELMPQLPSGLSARHIHVIDVIQRLSQKNSAVKVSDVSENDLAAMMVGHQTKHHPLNQRFGAASGCHQNTGSHR